MGYDEDLAERVRFALAGREDVDERKMSAASPSCSAAT
jgi:hypothetical protein